MVDTVFTLVTASAPIYIQLFTWLTWRMVFLVIHPILGNDVFCNCRKWIDISISKKMRWQSIFSPLKHHWMTIYHQLITMFPCVSPVPGQTFGILPRRPRGCLHQHTQEHIPQGSTFCQKHALRPCKVPSGFQNGQCSKPNMAVEICLLKNWIPISGIVITPI